MHLQKAEKASNIRSLARIHFIAGLPRSGVSVLTALLNQNPLFVAQSNSPALSVFENLVKTYTDGTEKTDLLDDGQKIALWRSGIDAVYHDRPFDSVVFDANRNWLPYLDILVRLYPLSRFIICLRNPAAIVNSIELTRPQSGDEETLAKSVNALMADDGEVGAEIGTLRNAMTSQYAERMLVLDYDRLTDDPLEAMEVIYDFLREPEFRHDFENLTMEKGGSEPVRRSMHPTILPTRMVLQLSGRAFWRNLRRTSATMLLGRSR